MSEHHAHQHDGTDVYDDCCQPAESDLVALIRSHLPATLAMQTGSWAEGQAAVLISNPSVVLRALGVDDRVEQLRHVLRLIDLAAGDPDRDHVDRCVEVSRLAQSGLTLVKGPACTTCGGAGCEADCGLRGGCEDAYSGPDSHKICRQCGGTGRRFNH